MYNVVLRKGLGVHLSKELRSKYKIRSVGLRKNDTVTIMRGKFSGRTGKVESINTKKARVYIEGIQIPKADGTKAKVGVNNSNLMVTMLDFTDKLRKAKIERNISKGGTK
jgi:large subunit ribosomal protein L26e